MSLSSELKRDVLRWGAPEVHAWLVSIGFERYAQLLADEHSIDGKTLLLLSEDDLREKPLQLNNLGDIKRLGFEIAQLRSRYNGFHVNPKSPSEDVLLCVDYEKTTDVQVAGKTVPIKTIDTAIVTNDELADTLSACGDVHGIHLISREELIRSVELAIAFIYCLGSLLITAFVMVIVHDRVPDMKTYPPLPDIVLDNLPLIPWAFDMAEMIGLVLCTIWGCVLLFHKHRVVVARRMFSMVGSVFLLRCITMLITSLSVPGVHLECRAKSYGSLKEKFWQAYLIWSRFGMSIQGVRSCGDYMFSGHTTTITLLNHFITEYTPASWTQLHTLTWVLNLFGIFFILAGHEHYSIDVFIAFYISSRMFLYYHAYAYNHANLTATDDRMRLWFPLGWFFEAGSKGKVINEYEFPISFPKFRKRSTEERPSSAERKELEMMKEPKNNNTSDNTHQHTNGTTKPRHRKGQRKE
ncbi:unnamed protein product, partial [Mesorhabditis spiculigera]